MTSMPDHLLSATRDAVRNAARTAATDCPEVAVLDRLLSRPLAPRAVEPGQPPVVGDWLATAVQAVATPRERGLADALLAAAPSLRWIAPYRPGDGADALAAGYAVTMLVGTGRPPRPGYQMPFVNPDVLVTFTLQAPGLFYPLHRHKAPEIYHVISGDRGMAAGRRALAAAPPRRVVLPRERTGPRHAHRRRAPSCPGRVDRPPGRSAPGAGGGRAGMRPWQGSLSPPRVAPRRRPVGEPA